MEYLTPVECRLKKVKELDFNSKQIWPNGKKIKRKNEDIINVASISRVCRYRIME